MTPILAEEKFTTVIYGINLIPKRVFGTWCIVTPFGVTMRCPATVQLLADRFSFKLPFNIYKREKRFPEIERIEIRKNPVKGALICLGLSSPSRKIFFYVRQPTTWIENFKAQGVKADYIECLESDFHSATSVSPKELWNYKIMSFFTTLIFVAVCLCAILGVLAAGTAIWISNQTGSSSGTLDIDWKAREIIATPIHPDSNSKTVRIKF